MLIRLISLFSFFIIQLASAQPPSVMNRGGANGRQMPTGSFYGKVLETTTGKPIELASVQLLQNKLDTATKKRKDVVVAGMLTRSNGEFRLENINSVIIGICFIGYFIHVTWKFRKFVM